MPSRIILTTFGSFGDLHPIISIANELRTRGHHPVIATSSIYKDKIEADGLGFHAVRPDLPPPHESAELTRRVMDPIRGGEYLYRQLLIPSLRNSFEDLCEAVRDADLLVSYPTTLAAPIVGEKLQKKWVSVHPWPMSIWSAYDASYASHMWLHESTHRLSPTSIRALRSVWMPMLNFWTKDVCLFRKELGIGPMGNPIFEGQYSPYAVLALMSPIFAPPQPDWPSNSTACGYCFHDKRGKMPGVEAEYSDDKLAPELQRFLECGEAPIVFTLGSAAVHTARNFFEHSLQAAQLLKHRALLLIGNEQNRPTGLPQNTEQIAAFNYAPYSLVFSHASVIVHQGGGGTIGQVLRAGKPSLTVPFGLDQPDHAMRLQRLGVGRFIRRRFYNGRRTARLLQELLENPEYSRRASEVGAQVRQENGAQAAADAIEKVLRS